MVIVAEFSISRRVCIVTVVTDLSVGLVISVITSGQPGVLTLFGQSTETLSRRAKVVLEFIPAGSGQLLYQRYSGSTTVNFRGVQSLVWQDHRYQRVTVQH